MLYQVRFIGATDDQVNWGANDDPRHCLAIGTIYTVVHEDVHSWHTKLELAECPCKRFNSASFVAVNEQP